MNKAKAAGVKRGEWYLYAGRRLTQVRGFVDNVVVIRVWMPGRRRWDPAIAYDFEFTNGYYRRVVVGSLDDRAATPEGER